MSLKNKLDTVTLQSPLLALSFIAIFAFLLAAPGTIDTISWIDWSKNIDEYGLIKGYPINNDVYPPLFYLYLYASSLIANSLDISIFYGIKITAFLSLLATSTIIYCWSNRNIATTFLFFIPLAYTCISLLYLEIYFAPYFLTSIYLLHKEKLIPSLICLAISMLIKQILLIIFPFLFIYLVKHYKKKSGSLGASTLNAITIVLSTIGILYLITLSIFGKAFLDTFITGFKEPGLVYQALNFNYLTSTIFKNSSEFFLGKIATPCFYFFFITTLLSFTIKKQGIESFLLFCLTGQFSYFIFSTGVHENHLYPSILLSICLTLINPRYLPLALNITLIHCINLLTFYGAIGTGLDRQTVANMYKVYELASFSQRPIEILSSQLVVICSFNILVFLATWISTVFFYKDQPSSQP